MYGCYDSRVKRIERLLNISLSCMLTVLTMLQPGNLQAWLYGCKIFLIDFHCAKTLSDTTPQSHMIAALFVLRKAQDECSLSFESNRLCKLPATLGYVNSCGSVAGNHCEHPQLNTIGNLHDTITVQRHALITLMTPLKIWHVIWLPLHKPLANEW